MTAEWLRRVFPPVTIENDESDDAEVSIDSPTLALNQRRSAVMSASNRLQTAMAEVRSVLGPANGPLVDEEGFPSRQVADIRTQLRAIDDQLMVWRLVHEQRYPAVADDDDLEDAE
jgi:hypothetical protein